MKPRAAFSTSASTEAGRRERVWQSDICRRFGTPSGIGWRCAKFAHDAGNRDRFSVRLAGINVLTRQLKPHRASLRRALLERTIVLTQSYHPAINHRPASAPPPDDAHPVGRYRARSFPGGHGAGGGAPIWAILAVAAGRGRRARAHPHGRQDAEWQRLRQELAAPAPRSTRP